MNLLYPRVRPARRGPHRLHFPRPSVSAPSTLPKDPDAEAPKEAGGLADNLRSVRLALEKASLARNLEVTFPSAVPRRPRPLSLFIQSVRRTPQLNGHLASQTEPAEPLPLTSTRNSPSPNTVDADPIFRCTMAIDFDEPSMEPFSLRSHALAQRPLSAIASLPNRIRTIQPNDRRCIHNSMDLTLSCTKYDLLFNRQNAEIHPAHSHCKSLFSQLTITEPYPTGHYTQ